MDNYAVFMDISRKLCIIHGCKSAIISDSDDLLHFEGFGGQWVMKCTSETFLKLKFLFFLASHPNALRLYFKHQVNK